MSGAVPPLAKERPHIGWSGMLLAKNMDVFSITAQGGDARHLLIYIIEYSTN
jgi:hypothetical protein